MLVGYVSDEGYAALPEVLLAFEGEGRWAEARSAANGAVHVDIPPGRYRVTLAKPGFGSKWVDVALSPDLPHQFRLLSDCLLGYPWPKYVQAGEESEFRVHSPEAYELELWRYGKAKEFIRRIGWFDDHGPRATIQILPDGDISQSGAQWNRFGYANPDRKQKVRAPARSGLYYFHARSASGHETDKITASSPKPIEHLAKGTNPDGGGADMVHYTTPSGGAVFSTGSITWTCSILIDDAVSRITANVLRRFVTEGTR